MLHEWDIVFHDELAGHGHDPDYASMNADIETNLRRVTPMLIRQPDDEVSIPPPFWHCSISVESHSVALQCMYYSRVIALQNSITRAMCAESSIVTVFSSLFSAILPQDECVT